nr:hypothetical protein [Angustibacter aerolatus]
MDGAGGGLRRAARRRGRAGVRPAPAAGHQPPAVPADVARAARRRRRRPRPRALRACTTGRTPASRCGTPAPTSRSRRPRRSSSPSSRANRCCRGPSSRSAGSRCPAPDWCTFGKAYLTERGARGA